MTPIGSPRRTTLRDVARRAEVSTATVSKVLHDRGDVGDATRERVRDALRDLDYAPVGRPVPPSVTTLTIAFDSWGPDYGTMVLKGVMEASQDAGIRTVIDQAPSALRGDDQRAWIGRQASAGARAAVLITPHITHELVDAAAERGISLIAIDPKNDDEASVVTIGATNWAGASAATNHLISLGHRRIAFAGMEMTSDFSLERFSGFRSSLERAGLPVLPDYVGYGGAGNAQFDDGRRIWAQFAQLPEPPTAVVAFCDAVALGVIEGARSSGTTVPDELSVVGFDDLPAARWSSPLLTTINQPLAEMGGLAVRTALDMMAGLPPATIHMQLATSRGVRDSTRPPRR